VITAMGIESDQVVYDYLSRVGDLAQATALTAAERARLVTGLRETIDSKRGAGGVSGRSSGSGRGEAAAVQKILSGIGSPDEVVRRAVHTGVPRTKEYGAATRAGTGRADAGQGGGRGGGDGGDGGYGPGPQIPVPAQGQARAGSTGDWWRYGGGSGTADGGADGGFGAAGPGFGGPGGTGLDSGELPGWRTTYEPDFLNPELVDPRVPQQRGPGDDQDAAEEQDPEQTAPRRSLLRRLFGSPSPVSPDAEEELVATRVRRGPLPLLESLAALVLLTAAALDLWYLALFGWLLTYLARRLGQGVNRFAAIGIPGLLAAALGFWFYSHTQGRPAGHQLTDAEYQATVRATFQLWLRTSAACSAVFLAWRISRRR
jgi:hypothetical protein